MSYDLALSENGDLIFAANRDLQGVSGIALIEQRMRLRLRMMRGQWQFDPEGTLGSRLYTLPGKSPEEASAQAQMYVREALREMDEIQVDGVTTSTTKDRGLEVHVQYHLTSDDGSTVPDLTLDLSVTVPVGG